MSTLNSTNACYREQMSACFPTLYWTLHTYVSGYVGQTAPVLYHDQRHKTWLYQSIRKRDFLQLCSMIVLVVSIDVLWHEGAYWWQSEWPVCLAKWPEYIERKQTVYLQIKEKVWSLQKRLIYLRQGLHRVCRWHELYWDSGEYC